MGFFFLPSSSDKAPLDLSRSERAVISCKKKKRKGGVNIKIQINKIKTVWGPTTMPPSMKRGEKYRASFPFFFSLLLMENSCEIALRKCFGFRFIHSAAQHGHPLPRSERRGGSRKSSSLHLAAPAMDDCNAAVAEKH